MVDYKTIRVPADDYDAAKASKHDSETWGEFVQRCTDEPPEIEEFVAFEKIEAVMLAQDEMIEYQEKTIDELEQQREILTELLEGVGNGSIDYAEIETRLKRVLEEVLHG